MIKSVWFKGTDDLADCFLIRTEVFIKEQGVSFEEEMDDLDVLATHVAAYENDKPIGCGRLLVQEDGTFLIGRIAVLKQYRGSGIGDFVVRLLVRKAFNSGANEAILHSQMSAKGFYEKIGFTAYGDEYMEADILHINMRINHDVGGNC